MPTRAGSSTTSCPGSARTAPAPATRWSPAARWAPTTPSSSRSPAPTCSRWRICQSGNYDPADWNAWGERGEAAYFTNPSDYVAHLHGDHLDWLRQRLHVVLVVGEGPWETHPTGSLPSARHLGGLLAEKGIPHELDVWGHDSAHDWDWWQKQIAHHLRGSADPVGADAASGEDGGDVAGPDDAQSGDRDQQGLSCPLEPDGEARFRVFLTVVQPIL